MARAMTPAALVARADVAALLDLDHCIGAVERAFRLHGEGRLPAPIVAGVGAADGGFHIKAGLYEDSGRAWFVAKLNANIASNPVRRGLPTIQGLLVLSDGESGVPLAVMDSVEITALRTGAATAVAAKHLARPDSHVVTLCGCGVQGRVQLRALSRVCRLERAYLYDADRSAAERMAEELGPEPGMELEVAPVLRDAVRKSDVCVTCTPAHAPLLGADALVPGLFIAAVGADSPKKQELDPALFAGSTIVVDVLEQCAAMGDLHHALAAGTVTRDAVHAELGAIVAGRRPGRRHRDEIVIFDSTGMALQDAAAAILVYERIRAGGRDVPAFDFAR